MKFDSKLAAVVLVVALVFLNVYVFVLAPLSPQRAVACYKDVCVVSPVGTDPVSELKQLVASSNHALIVYESDRERTQRSSYLAAGFTRLGALFGSKQPLFAGVSFENNAPVECVCSDLSGRQGNATSCVENSTSYCLSLAPGAGEFLLKLEYPDFSKNEIVVENRTISVRAKSGEDALAVVIFLEELLRA